MKQIILSRMRREYTLEPREMGSLRTIQKFPYRFDCEAYTVKGVGNLFFISMKAMFGLMTMSTAVITPLDRDLSFANFDIVKAAGKETYMFEMYKSALHDPDFSSFRTIRKEFGDLTDYESKPRWYDALRLEPSISKTGRKIGGRAERMMETCLEAYLVLLRNAPECDREAKKKAVEEYTGRLISEGGAAVDSMNKIIGREKTAELISTYMYGL